MIAYIDLNFPDFSESYSTHPKSYGGGRIFASLAKESIKDFYIFSDKKSFQDLNEFENKQNCIIISNEQKELIRNGKNLQDVIPEIKNFKIIVHHFANRYINTDIPQIIWAVGYGEYIHPKIHHLMLYSRDRQGVIITNNNIKIYDVVIGVPIEKEFIYHDKEDYIFQCSRHTKTFGSIEVAKFCLENKIKCIFAGPIDVNYDLLKYIDNNTTFYLGQISEHEKINYVKKARLCTFMHSWNTPFNLSAITSLAYGTPIAATNIGFWSDLIFDNYNGFLINNINDLIYAWKNSKLISQENCYYSVNTKYSSEQMLSSFEKAIKEVIK